MREQENREKDKAVKKLYCVVTNSSILGTGLESECIFDPDGGSIGSGDYNKWVLTSYGNDIAEKQCSITVIDDNFCLIDHAGLTRINNANMPMESNIPVALKSDDIIHIGDYEIKADVITDENKSLYEMRKSDLSSMFPDETGASHIIPDGLTGAEGRQSAQAIDPLIALGGSEKKSEYQHKESYEETLWDNKSGTRESDYDYQMDAMIYNKQRTGYNPFNDVTSVDVGEYMEDNNSYLATGPLMRGLGVALSYSDHSGEMQYFAEEMGESLKETISGLLRLHQEVTNNRYGVLNKNFQPIIDNPLKMGLDYTETVKLMYDAKASLVHLAAPAAIKENLELIINHQKAVHRAISEALAKVLEAFSPEALMRRFVQYRSSRNLSKESNKEWAWDMYKAYHEELISNRQTGFNKLFWEVFDQVYDREMRTLEKEKYEEKPYDI